MIEPRAAVKEMPLYIPGRSQDVPPGEQGPLLLASNESPYGPSPKAIAQAQGALDRLHRYPEPHPAKLHQALSALHGLSVDHFTLGTGEDDVIRTVAGTFLAPGQHALIMEPTFQAYQLAARAVGAMVDRLPLPADGVVDVDAVLSQIHAGTRMVFVCTPNNPTGGAVEGGELERLAHALHGRDVVLVIDEAYGEFVDGDPRYPSAVESLVSRYDHVLVLRTFSKAYGLAGLRIGWAAGAPSLIGWLNRIRPPFPVNQVAAAAALAAIEDQAYLTSVVTRTRATREQFVRELARRHLVALPSLANFITIRLGSSARQLVDQLAQEGVFVRLTDAFGLPGHIRVTLPPPEDVDRFWRAFDGVVATRPSGS